MLNEVGTESVTSSLMGMLDEGSSRQIQSMLQLDGRVLNELLVTNYFEYTTWANHPLIVCAWLTNCQPKEGGNTVYLAGWQADRLTSLIVETKN